MLAPLWKYRRKASVHGHSNLLPSLGTEPCSTILRLTYLRSYPTSGTTAIFGVLALTLFYLGCFTLNFSRREQICPLFKSLLKYYEPYVSTSGLHFFEFFKYLHFEVMILLEVMMAQSN